jgi:hypothetical protein
MLLPELLLAYGPSFTATVQACASSCKALTSVHSLLIAFGMLLLLEMTMPKLRPVP